MFPSLDPNTTEVNPRFCTVGGGRNNPDLTLLEVLAEQAPSGLGRPSARFDGWRVLDPDDFESVAHLLRISVRTAYEELKQVGQRGSVEAVPMGDGQWRYRFTELGLERLAGVRRMR